MIGLWQSGQVNFEVHSVVLDSKYPDLVRHAMIVVSAPKDPLVVDDVDVSRRGATGGDRQLRKRDQCLRVGSEGNRKLGIESDLGDKTDFIEGK